MAVVRRGPPARHESPDGSIASAEPDRREPGQARAALLARATAAMSELWMILAPILFFPFSKTLFLAFDLLFRPATRDELS
jgi:hypothetical protein